MTLLLLLLLLLFILELFFPSRRVVGGSIIHGVPAAAVRPRLFGSFSGCCFADGGVLLPSSRYYHGSSTVVMSSSRHALICGPPDGVAIRPSCCWEYGAYPLVA